VRSASVASFPVARGGWTEVGIVAGGLLLGMLALGAGRA